MEGSIEKTTMKADKAEVISEAEKWAQVEAFSEACKIVAAKVAAEEKKKKKKKTKVVTRRLTQKQIDAVLSTKIWTRPMPVCTDELLAGLDEDDDKEFRDSIRDNMASAAAAVYKSREEMKLRKERMLAELQTKGYVEREIYVTDDEATDDDEGSSDM